MAVGGAAVVAGVVAVAGFPAAASAREVAAGRSVSPVFPSKRSAWILRSSSVSSAFQRAIRRLSISESPRAWAAAGVTAVCQR